MPQICEIIHAIEQAAPRSAQEQWDNSGLIVDSGVDHDCTGVMLCLDITPGVVEQAAACKCNLIVSHHPLIFKGIKTISKDTPQGEALIQAIKNEISVYSAHTSLDNAPEAWNVSGELARMLGFRILGPLSESGTGVIAEAPNRLTPAELNAMCCSAFGVEHLRFSRYNRPIKKIAIGSGACGFLIPEAIGAECDAMITSDVRYHDFLDYGQRIFIVDLTHYDTEKCTKAIFKHIISQNFLNFADVFCASETNPIEYL